MKIAAWRIGLNSSRRAGMGGNRYAYNILSGFISASLMFDYHYETHSTDSKAAARRIIITAFFILLLPQSFPGYAAHPPAEGFFSQDRAGVLADDIDLESAEFSGHSACAPKTRSSPTTVLQRADDGIPVGEPRL